MTLLVRPHAPDADGMVIDVTPASAGWDHVGFRLVRLRDGMTHAWEAPDRECCIVPLTGTVDVTVGGERYTIGGRTSVFDGTTDSLYVPAGLAVRMASAEADVAICSAPGTGAGQVRTIAAAEMARETRGQGTNTRHVSNILPETAPADSLLVVEVVTPGGNWSSYPPHKHDVDDYPNETLLEETYYHRLSRPQGFAVQRVYTDDRSIDETMTVGDGDVVLVPRGYHPVAAAHGYDLYYLNVMAGPRRAWKFVNDPAHDWIVRP